MEKLIKHLSSKLGLDWINKQDCFWEGQDLAPVAQTVIR